MKKMLIFVLLVLLAGCGPTATPAPPTATPPTPVDLPDNPNVEQCTALRVSNAVGWYPLFFKNPTTDAIEGLNVDLFNRLEADLGVPVEILVDLPWNRMLAMLERGELEVMGGAYWTSERDALYHYTIAYAQDEVRVFVLRDKAFPLNDLSDLRGKLGDRPLGGSYGEAFDAYAEQYLTLDETPGKETVFRKLQYGRTDYAIYAYWDALAYLRETNLEDDIIPLDYQVAVNPIHMMVTRANACGQLVGQIDTLLEHYIAEGVIDTLLEQYR